MKGIRLDQYTLKIQCAQKLPEGRPFVGIAVTEGGLGDRHAKIPCVERHLGDKPRRAIGAIELRRRPSQGLAVND